MPIPDITPIANQIKTGKLSPVYLLWGEEDYFIDQLTDLFENHVLDEMQKEFDFSVYFAPDLKSKEPGLQGVMANCKRFPVIAPFQLIIIKEAQGIDTWEPIEDYLQHPVSTTVLVLIHKHKKIDKRKSVFKLISKIGVSFESSPQAARLRYRAPELGHAHRIAGTKPEPDCQRTGEDFHQSPPRGDHFRNRY